MAGVVLVTGASGFAGSHLLELLRDTNTVAWSRTPPPAGLAPLATWQQVDLLDRDRVRDAIAALKPSHVYHFAGFARVAPSWTDTVGPLAGNVLTTHYLLDALRRAGVKSRVLIPGSAMVYRPGPEPLSEDAPIEPASPYAVTKVAQEQLGVRAVREDGIEVVLTRSFNHTGPRQRPGFFAPDMARQIAAIERGAEPIIRVGNLEAKRDLADVRDTVRAYALLMERGRPGTIYNVATGTAHSMRTVLYGLVRRSRIPVRIEADPERLRPHDVPILVGNAARLRAATGWAPEVGFDRMLDDLLCYWRARTEHDS